MRRRVSAPFDSGCTPSRGLIGVCPHLSSLLAVVKPSPLARAMQSCTQRTLRPYPGKIATVHVSVSWPRIPVCHRSSHCRPHMQKTLVALYSVRTGHAEHLDRTSVKNHLDTGCTTWTRPGGHIFVPCGSGCSWAVSSAVACSMLTSNTAGLSPRIVDKSSRYVGCTQKVRIIGYSVRGACSRGRTGSSMILSLTMAGRSAALIVRCCTSICPVGGRFPCHTCHSRCAWLLCYGRTSGFTGMPALTRGRCSVLS